MNKIIFLLIAILTVACGNIIRPNLPLTKEESLFFNRLNKEWLSVDSIRRDLEVGQLLFRKFDETVITNIYLSNDNLTVEKKDLLSNQIAAFYATNEINNIKFKFCIINYYDSKNSERENSFHIFRYEGSTYISDIKGEY